jgi:hypothetical protein
MEQVVVPVLHLQHQVHRVSMIKCIRVDQEGDPHLHREHKFHQLHLAANPSLVIRACMQDKAHPVDITLDRSLRRGTR